MHHEVESFQVCTQIGVVSTAMIQETVPSMPMSLHVWKVTGEH